MTTFWVKPDNAKLETVGGRTMLCTRRLDVFPQPGDTIVWYNIDWKIGRYDDSLATPDPHFPWRWEVRESKNMDLQCQD